MQQPSSDDSERCEVCDEAADHVIGVAAMVRDRLRFWLGGCCDEHQAEVRERCKSHAREFGIPEITVTQLLRAGDVAGWVRRLEQEMTQKP